MNEPKEEEESLPLPPAASNNKNVPALPQTPPFIGTDCGVDNEKARPHSPPANAMSATTSNCNTAAATRSLLGPTEPLDKMAVTQQTPPANLPQVAPGGSGKHRIYTRQDEEIVSAGNNDDLMNTEDDVLSWMKPGAVSVGGIAPFWGRSSTSQTTGQLVGDSGLVATPFETQIIAFLAPEDDEKQVESRIVQKAEELLRRQMEEGEVIVAAEVKDDASSTCFGLKKRTVLVMGVLSLLMMIGGVVVGVLSSKARDAPGEPAPTPAPTVLGDALLEELMFLNATFEKDLWRFEDPGSPQYQALEWMKNDTIVMSSGRSKQDLLQRYVLAVVFYSANGPNWVWTQSYLSSDDVCSWNKGSEDYGVYCRLDGESVDELKLSDESTIGSGWKMPWELGLLTTLTMLELDCTGTIQTNIGQLTSLTYLDIGGNQLTGTIPTELGQLTSLTYLEIGSNQLTGTLPSELGQLTSLESLDMSTNLLIGTLPTELGQLLSLENLDMSTNMLIGTLPTELGQLVSLQNLAIYTNQLNGTIPLELGQLVSLESLVMYYNQLTGTIPTELGQLLSLESLVMYSNQLTGTIPLELGQLVSLESFVMHYNQLTGTIPTELGQLISLTYLSLWDNQLTGTIPSELAGIANLTKIYFHENSLTGSMEHSFCAENSTRSSSWVVDCDKVECSCCGC